MRSFAPWRRAAIALALLLLVIYAGLVALRILFPLGYVEPLVAWSAQHGLEPALVAAVVRCESRFRAQIVSPRGAVGLMQIMPETAEWIAEKLGWSAFDPDLLNEPDANLRLGTWYLAYLRNRFGSIEQALHAYNAGPSHAEHWIEAPDDVFPETLRFVARVSRILPLYRFYFSAPWLLRITPSLLV